MTRVTVNPDLLRWACERVGVAPGDLVGKFPKLLEWVARKVRPTVKQVEAFARAVHLPVGYLFLAEPPEEPVPIPDYRTVAGQPVAHPSPDLLETIYACQERQAWYRDYIRSVQEPGPGFVGSATVKTPPETAAARMSEVLGFDLAARRECPDWNEALRRLVRRVDEIGVLVMVSGVVLSNTHRRLDLAEFRGFALCDPLAPLVFINGADTRAAQIFTLAHELAHLWLGVSALSDLDPASRRGFRREENWCNAVAAELLAPLAEFTTHLRGDEGLSEALPRLARVFKVSHLVILRRLLDAGWLDRARFDVTWERETARLGSLAQSGRGGGNFHHTTLSRVGHRFARAVVGSTLEGRTLYRDAFRMLGVSKTETFNTLGRTLGLMG